jgi:hypothetical protein
MLHRRPAALQRLSAVSLPALARSFFDPMLAVPTRRKHWETGRLERLSGERVRRSREQVTFLIRYIWRFFPLSYSIFTRRDGLEVIALDGMHAAPVKRNWIPGRA